ncbi:MAG: cadherin-like beta sandwich domain-containing protein, partial [Chthoniobacter sp.]|nr:cadherin-like beta sandwich domain-containing protein [Chthoniobacter sp.]
MRTFLAAAAAALALFTALPASAAVVNATFNAATDVPVTAGSYTATGNTVNLTLNFAPTTGTNLTVVENTGLGFISGTFGNLTQGQTVALTYGGVIYTFVASYYGGTGNDLVLRWANVRPVAWGLNGDGQLGDNSTTDRLVPVTVVQTGVLAGKTVTAVANGGYHSLALCSDGTLAAWGSNASGQLGDNSGKDSIVPVAVLQSGVLAGKTVIAVAAGFYHSLALCSDGTMAAWGSNTSGQLGNNSTTESRVPVAVVQNGVLAGKSVVAVAAGWDHCLVLCSDGTVAAWGANFSGQLGNNSTTNSLVPVAVVQTGVLAGKTVIAVAAGVYNNLALCSDGMLAAWGSNTHGAYGNGTTTNGLVPVAVNQSGVLAGKAVVAMAASQHNLVLCSDGTLASWGRQDFWGQLGNNLATNGLLPGAVDMNGVLAGKTVIAVAAGAYHSLALCSDGTLASWGRATWGQLGNNSATDSPVPVLVSTAGLGAGERFVVVGSGRSASHNLAVVASPPPTAATSAATAIRTTGAILNGTVTATGNSAAVSFDYGTTAAYGANVAASPASVTGGAATAVSTTLTGLTPGTTYHFRVRVTNAGSAGYGSDLTFDTPPQNANLNNLTLSSGTLSPAFATATTDYTATTSSSSVTITPVADDASATIRVNGTVVASGSASDPFALNVGPNTITTVVTTADGLTTQTYTAIVTRAPLSWTYNTASDIPEGGSSFSASGTATLTLNFAPPVGRNLTVVQNTGPDLISGAFTNLAQGQVVPLTYNGITYSFVVNYYGGTGNDLVLQWANVRPLAWGSNNNGQLGNNSTTASLVPVGVVQSGVLAGRTVIAVSVGGSHSLALCADGTLAAWGLNDQGQLGNGGAMSFSRVPVAVVQSGVLAGKTVIAVCAGQRHSLALCSDGTLAAWGGNGLGQLGNGPATTSRVPVPVFQGGVLAGKRVVAVVAGQNHNVALCSDGSLAGWGLNTSGQLGNNGTTTSLVPVAVVQTGVLAGKTVVAVVAGSIHSLALCSYGTLAAWGQNNNGQLGISSTTQSNVPVIVLQSGVLAGRTVTAMAGGNSHSLALCSDGTLAAWGGNGSGQLGINSTTTSLVPVSVNTTALASGERFTAATSSSLAGHTLALVAVPPPLPSPTATTLAATAITATGATLNGTVNANGSSTAVSFDYGSTVAYGSNVAGMPTPVTGGTTTAVSTTLTGLTPGTTYHFRVNGVSAGGTVTGSDLSFITPRSNADLTDLVLSSGALTPAFAPGTFAYTATVDYVVSAVTLTPAVADGAATVTVNGIPVTSGTPSGSLPLLVGTNSLVTIVTAQDGTSMRTYTVTVTRQSAIDNWRQFHFGNNTAFTGNDQDYNHNGIINLLEFAFGTNPVTSTAGVL